MSYNQNSRASRNNPKESREFYDAQNAHRSRGRKNRHQGDPESFNSDQSGRKHENQNRKGQKDYETEESPVVTAQTGNLNPGADEYVPSLSTKPSSQDSQSVPETPVQDTSLDDAAKFLPTVAEYDSWNDAPVSSTTNKLQDQKYKATKNTVPPKIKEKSIAVTPMPGKLEANDNFKKKVSNYEVFMQKNEAKTFKDMKHVIVEEINGNLFDMGKEYALANCVAADLNMGSGIAVTFRQDFKGFGELMSQNPHTGGLVFLHHNDERYIYYLITKKESVKKPTYETLYKSLEKLCEHMVANEVKLLAIPRLGCGLDRLEWDIVKPMIEYVFSGTDIKITCCNFQQADEQMRQKKTDLKFRKCPSIYLHEPIKTIKPYAIVLYIGAVDGGVDENLVTLFNRFPTAQADYRRNNPGQLGKHIVTVVENYKYYVVGCIAKKSIKDLHVDYVQFEKCISDVKKSNEKFRRDGQHYEVVAIQQYDSPKDDIYMEKLVNMLKTYFFGVTICIYNH